MNGPKSGWRGGALCAAAVLCLGASCLAQDEGESVVESARTELVGGTSDDASIPVEQLRVRLRPLAREQLEAEAESWFELLQAKIAEVGEVELEIHALDDADQAGPEAEALRDQLVELRTAESDLIARLQIVATALKEKGGDVTAVEQYLAAVSDLKNSADTSSRLAALTAAARSWIRSPEGGLLFGKRIALALVILLIFWIISRYAGRLVGKGLESRPEISNLLTNFAKRMAGGVTLVIGILMALAALGVSIGPLMAALGAGGFIVGFALQETLASFASGMMIMIYRPFDVDDYVQVAGVEGSAPS